MSSFFSRLARLSPFRRRKPVGYDLEGNRYYEAPGVNGGRTKRTVEYRIERDISEYTSGQKLPVQWTSWMAHTRSHPPTIQELQGDEERRAKLTPLVQAIEAREHAERIRQGYIEAPGGAPLQISSERHAAMPPLPSSRVQAEIEALKRSSAVVEPAALPQGSEEVTPPAAPLDVRRDNAPASNDELRRLAEEDTKRRLKEMTGPPPAPEMPAAKEVDSWAPTRRRRGV